MTAEDKAPVNLPSAVADDPRRQEGKREGKTGKKKSSWIHSVPSAAASRRRKWTHLARDDGCGIDCMSCGVDSFGVIVLRACCATEITSKKLTIFLKARAICRRSRDVRCGKWALLLNHLCFSEERQDKDLITGVSPAHGFVEGPRISQSKVGEVSQPGRFGFQRPGDQTLRICYVGASTASRGVFGKGTSSFFLVTFFCQSRTDTPECLSKANVWDGNDERWKICLSLSSQRRMSSASWAFSVLQASSRLNLNPAPTCSRSGARRRHRPTAATHAAGRSADPRRTGAVRSESLSLRFGWSQSGSNTKPSAVQNTSLKSSFVLNCSKEKRLEQQWWSWRWDGSLLTDPYIQHIHRYTCFLRPPFAPGLDPNREDRSDAPSPRSMDNVPRSFFIVYSDNLKVSCVPSARYSPTESDMSKTDFLEAFSALAVANVGMVQTLCVLWHVLERVLNSRRWCAIICSDF